MSYHRFNNLAELLNRDLAAKKSGGEYFPKASLIDNITVLFHSKSTENVSTKVNADQDVLSMK